MVWVLVALVVAFIVWSQIRKKRRHDARRATLHQDGTGYWVWVEHDGSTRTSTLHPEKPGGDWYSESGSDGGGDHGGGDGSGDGGGGGGD